MPTSPPNTSSSSSQPLLHEDREAATSNSYSRSAESSSPHTSRSKVLYNSSKQQVQDFLSSRAQHYTVLALVSFDLLGIFADIIINLYQCDEKDTAPIWDDVRNGLGIAGLVFSCLFMLELILSVWAFGWRFVCLFLPVCFLFIFSCFKFWRV